MKKDIEIKELLFKEFGLSDKEVSLFLFFLGNGPSSVLEASRDTGFPRTTTHQNIDSLIEKGLLKQIGKGQGSRRLILPEPPEKLTLILEQKISNAESAKKQIPSLIERFIQSLGDKTTDFPPTKLRVYKNRNEVNLIYDEALKAKNFYSYVNSSKLPKVFPNNPQKFVDEMKKRSDMELWEIIEESSDTDNYLESLETLDRYHHKIVPPKLGFSIPDLDYLIFDGKVATINFRGRTVNGMIIEDIDLYEHAKGLFNLVWKLLD